VHCVQGVGKTPDLVDGVLDKLAAEGRSTVSAQEISKVALSR
jgi:hypothetical protein